VPTCRQADSPAEGPPCIARAEALGSREGHSALTSASADDILSGSTPFRNTVGRIVSTVPATASLSTPLTRPKLVVWFLTTIVIIHLLALLAFLPYVFVWWGILLVLAGNFVFGSIGINLGYHRMLTHKAAGFPKFFERLWVLCGVCSLEGSPLWWVCVHRMHHQHSDEAGDPHTPRESFFWGHMQWIFTADPRQRSLSTFEKYVPDLMSDPFLRWLHRGNKWILIYALHALLIGAIGLGLGFLIADTTAGALQIGAQVFVWGVLVRTVYVWHITWLVNSASHRWGYRNYETDDRSRNNVVVALLTNGEGWHNNHHATPRACSQGHKWWEIDLTYTFVRLLQVVGLAWEVVPVRVPKHIQEQKTEGAQEPPTSG
jgi:fatty-acid desaturase